MGCRFGVREGWLVFRSFRLGVLGWIRFGLVFRLKERYGLGNLRILGYYRDNFSYFRVF